jgi:pyruvate,water dikinase
MSPLWRRRGIVRKWETADAFGVLFNHFRRVVTINNQILEKIADLERVLGGEYVYDRSFLQNAVTEIVEKGRHVIYHLNAMADDRYDLLYERFTTTGDHLADILAGGPGPYGPQLVLSWEVLHRDLRHLAGGKGASLGEAVNSLKLPSPVGFVVSTTGYRRFMQSNNLFAPINDILRHTADPAVQAARIGELFAGARLPHDLAAAISQAVKKLRSGPLRPDRFAVRSSGVDEDGARSFAGQFQSFLDVPGGEVAAACVRVMASRFAERVCRYLERGTPAEAAPMAVVVQPMVTARASGVLYTRDPNNPAAEAMVLSAVAGLGDNLVAGRDSGDRFVFDRNHPFTPRISHIGLRSEGAGGKAPDPLALMPSGMRRGSGVVGLEVIRKLAEYGTLLEKRFEYPQDIEWCLDADGAVWILQSRPLRLPLAGNGRTPAQLAAELAKLPVLMANRGHICQLGLAGGRVMQVTEDTPAESFPVGGVAVSHYASPRLAEIVRRAAAVITDVGSPTSHLATIAREYRTPALFGAEKATRLLPDGAWVMVDVEAQTVYQGRVELPADLPHGGGLVPLPDNREESLLRSLLRLIAPLNLDNPASPAFRMENCLTIHDFLRFCHERAVAELIGFHTSGRLVAGGGAPLLDTALPIKLRIIDIGRGLAVAGEKRVRPDQVASMPLHFLLQGLLDTAFWDQEPVPFGIRDLLSGITRPLTFLTHAPAYSGENLAIIAENYCNLSLRLGYHFNIIDCYLSDESDDNHVYFRFVGGFAEAGKRERRAAMIAQVLAGLHFKVEQKGDLVLGKVKMLERSHLESILVHLGELIAFTRQLDVRMVDDAAVERFFTEFINRIGQAPGGHGDGYAA